jgi:eukaryotic-like serine/threonine-protein kinase
MPDELDSSSEPRPDRILAAILSADVAGYTRLMSQDEEQTLLTFQDYAQEFVSRIALHGGEVFNTAGDAILAQFPRPMLAVRCATEIQAELRTRNDQLPRSRQVRFRIGINLGDVMLHGRKDLLGEGVNLAARVQASAEPGGIYITGSVHDQIRNKLPLSFRFLGRKRYKDIPYRVPTFAITQAEGCGAFPFSKSRWPLWIATAALILLAGAGYYYWRRTTAPPGPRLTDKDTIVLADFANTTGDPIFDGTLRQGLSTQLEQSPFLSLISDQRIGETLALMSQPKDARLSKELGREVCQRTASAADIEGSIASLGNQYVLGLSAVNCHNGDLLAEVQETANGKAQVLQKLGDAATKLRKRLGESLGSVEKYDVPLENATTPSLEALQAYSLGRQALAVKSDLTGAIPFFQKAVDVDPNFAMAYARLGRAETTRRAYDLRERASEREKFYISSHYELDVTGNLETLRTTCESWARIYPRDDDSQVNLQIVYSLLGEHEKALTAAREALALNPGSGVGYANLVLAYAILNRLEEVKATAQEARAHNLDGPLIHRTLYLVAFLQHDVAGMERENEDGMLNLQADTAAYGGQFAKARDLRRQAADEKEAAAVYQAKAAVQEALVENFALAKQQAEAALAVANGRDVEGASAIALGLAGDFDQAAQLAGDLGKRFPEDTLVQSQYLPMIHAAAAIRSGDASKAVDELKATVPHELGLGANLPLYPVYLRGQAYLAVRQGHNFLHLFARGSPALGTAAEVEFRKILDHPGVVVNDPIGALAHLGLGRAYALSGDSAKAKTAYQDFFNLWKDADPDVPLLQQARAEFAKLK